MDHFLWSHDVVVDHFGSWGDAYLAPNINQDGDNGGGEGYGDEHGEAKVGSASKNHSEAEKRRRDRINAHLTTLRKLVSRSDKMDKATLLGKVVEHIRELKSQTTELSKVVTIPTDSDEVIINFVSNIVDHSNKVFINVSICCEDRIELISEINHTLKTLKLTMVQANMTCLGGRIKCNFILCVKNNMNTAEMTTLKQSLKVLLGRIVSSACTTSSSYRIKSKRQRFFCSSDYNTKGFE
ncbi:hypothetical protein QVD17_07311 [Tagetes erecta]|uniref:BHLH domain-containing protein n=1 Tax=Tagetes erecta TaxID=13708 RepID=A0AAD8LH47_TARER|nr:hypothetical protein QVD17_07311 [Tagetes erecta]